MSKTFLIIQTAFTGDVILATSLLEKLHEKDSGYALDILVRKGNEGLFINHPFIRETIVWDKKKNKYRNLFGVLKSIRSKKYDYVINLQRFAGTGMLTAFSSAKEKIGFNKNPLSFLLTRSVKHAVDKGLHETERNQKLISHITDENVARPRLYPTTENNLAVEKLKTVSYMTIAPGSVWFTKTFPEYKWIELISALNLVTSGTQFYLLGSKEEYSKSENIISKSPGINIKNLCGSLSMLESAALMKDAAMNFVNDSAPLHLASAMNAAVTAIYCSTVPEFGFGPLSDNSKIVQTRLTLDCRPCGLHGYKDCPMTHFKCAHTIDITEAILE